MLAFSIIAGLHARLLAADPCGAHPTVEPAECGQDHPCDSGHSHDTPSDDGDRQPHPSGHHHEGCFHAMPLMTDPPVSHSARCWPISHYKPRRPRWSRSRTCVTSSGKTTPGITSAQLPSGDRPTRRPAMVANRVRDYFNSSPLKLKVDTGSSLKTCITAIFDEAKKRQSENRGSTVLRAVMQHLVGAKLEVLYPHQTIEHSGYTVVDSPTGRSRDFQIGDCVIHVTTAPGAAVIRKCSDNLDQGLRPLIVSTQAGAALAETLAEELEHLAQICSRWLGLGATT